MSDVELVVTDLDGSLWFADEVTHPATVAAWQELERRGVPVLVATGRRVASTRDPLARLGFAPPAVVMNGALVLELGSGARYHSHPYTAADAAIVLAAFREVGLEPCVYVDHADVDVFVGDRPSTNPAHLVSLGSTLAEGDLDVIVGEIPVLMFGIMGHDEAALAAVATVLGGAAESHLDDSNQYEGHTFTVTPPGLSKWIGVEVYCARAGFDVSRVLAIGDGPNDCELLAGAAVAVVPKDACVDALQLADHIVASPRDGGWAEILDLV